MISRMPVVCPGCSAKIRVRLGLGPTDGTKFYFPCPSCRLPIDGYISGRTLDTTKVNFRGAKEFEPDIEPDVIVTVDPNIPLRFESTKLSEFGGAPSAIYVELLGDSVLSVSHRLSALRESIFTGWDDIQNLYEYYLYEQWTNFDKLAREFFDGCPDELAPPARDSAAFRSLMIALTGLETSEESSYRILMELKEKLESFSDIPEFIRYANQAVDSGVIARDQRRLWDCVKNFMKARESSFPGAIMDAAKGANVVDKSELRLCRDDFAQLRDIYVSSFEVCCKSLTHLVAMINTSLRGAPERMRTDISEKIALSGMKKLPATTLRKFDKLPSAIKFAYLDE